jgi:hypothetical protein
VEGKKRDGFDLGATANARRVLERTLSRWRRCEAWPSSAFRPSGAFFPFKQRQSLDAPAPTESLHHPPPTPMLDFQQTLKLWPEFKS